MENKKTDVNALIYDLLYSHPEGMCLTDIAANLKISKQLTHYHLKRLCIDDLVILDNYLYYLQPFLYSLNLKNVIFDWLKKIMGKVQILQNKNSPFSKIDILKKSLKFLIESTDSNAIKLFLTDI